MAGLRLAQRYDDSVNKETSRRILIIRVGHLGDSIMATAAIEPLIAKYGPDVLIDYASGPGVSAEILRLDRRIHRVFPIEARRKPWWINRSKKALRNHARHRPYDIVINLESGKECDDFADFLCSGQFLGRPHSPPDRRVSQHAVEMESSVYQSLLAPGSAVKSVPKLVPTDAVSLTRPAPGTTLVVINPGFSGIGQDNYRSHRAWPEDHWCKLIEKLTADDRITVAVNGTAEEAPLLKPMTDMRGVFSLLGSTLGELVDAVRQAHCVISVDTGTGHLAAALDTPTIALFGPSLPGLTRPLSRTTATMVLSSDIDCQPCYGTALRKRCTFNRCMHELSVTMVMAAYDEISTGANPHT